MAGGGCYGGAGDGGGGEEAKKTPSVKRRRRRHLSVGLFLSTRLDLGVSLKDLTAVALPYEKWVLRGWDIGEMRRKALQVYQLKDMVIVIDESERRLAHLQHHLTPTEPLLMHLIGSASGAVQYDGEAREHKTLYKILLEL
ncbi:hypothetical protein RHGRI_005159 [Rhododendron griersonianum]|uniref:Uncharacterized protein n=1 Tax=Rhododendron griersonianum TaxID=479676 RepID=A0AAV6LEE9_9ERIC|nr:hypothetical protein RHGRI_005159 [Rhododendron griersonianum]